MGSHKPVMHKKMTPLVCMFCGKTVEKGTWILDDEPVIDYETETEEVLYLPKYTIEYDYILEFQTHISVNIFRGLQITRVPNFVYNSCLNCLKDHIPELKTFRELADIDIASNRLRKAIATAKKQLKKEIRYEESNYYW